MTDQEMLKKLATEYNVDHGAYDEDHSLLRLLIRVHKKITYFHEEEA